MELKHIVLIVKDLEKSIRFYEKFGFKLNAKEEGFAEFNLGNINIALLSESVASDLIGKEKINFNDKKDFLLGIETSDVDQAVRDLKGKGIEFFKDPETKSWGQRVAYCKDPDGNIIEISSWVK